MGADRFVVPDLPENLYSQPTLVWLLENHHAGEQTVEASYLANQINWSADYVLTIGPNEKSADLNGWVTLVNNSGTGFRNAQLQLVAGEPHRVYNQVTTAGVAEMERMAKAASAPFQPEELPEYHPYTRSRTNTTPNNQSKHNRL